MEEDIMAANASLTPDAKSADTEAEPAAPVSRPILFSAPMVRALLDGRKTQTRRAIKGVDMRQAGGWLASGLSPAFVAEPGNRLSPYGYAGDELWVREAHALHERFTDVVRVVYGASLPGGWNDAHEDFPAHLADGLKIKPFQQGFRPSIHMPRWASRISLRITDVRVERLNEISEADALAEGVYPGEQPPETFSRSYGEKMPVHLYGGLWEHINGPGSWDANPWVWAVSFTVERGASPASPESLGVSQDASKSSLLPPVLGEL